MGTSSSSENVELDEQESQSHAKVLLAGLNQAGKTTLLEYLTQGKVTATMPTFGATEDTVRIGGVSLRVCEVGGHEIIIPLWKQYTAGTHAIVYVVDSTDRERLDESRIALYSLIEDMESVPLLILANKHTNEGAMSNEELTKGLSLDTLPSCDWHIERTCAKSGSGIKAAMMLLCDHILQTSNGHVQPN